MKPSSFPQVARGHVTAFLGRLGGTAPFRWVPRSTLAPLLIIGGLSALTVLVFEKQIFDHWTFPWDFVGPPATTPAFVAASVGSGHFLSWSPFVAGGFPVDVDPQAGMYFPGWWLLGVLKVPATLRVLTTVQAAHVLFGSVGVLALARARRLWWSWAAVAAVAYLFFGGFYGEAEHADYFRGFAYLPWLLWALTPPNGIGRWARLAASPPLVWLVVSGAYPGQVVSFGITGLVYVSVALRAIGPGAWRRHRTALTLAIVSGAAVCAAVLLPYLQAEQAHELYRAFEPTAAIRAGESISPLDLLGLYLNNFAWIYDGTVTAWAVAIPILIGFACVRLEALRRHAPLVACGAVALALAMTPKIGVVGRAMVSLRPLFPSRFPAADYKAVVAVALVVLGAEAWSQIDTRRFDLARRAALAGCVLVAGALLAPSTYGQPTRELWLLIAVVLACVTLVLVRLPRRLLACLLVALVVIDGHREIDDYHLGPISPWRVSPSEVAPYRARDVYVRRLPALLAEPPASRPARIPSYAPLSSAPTGTPPDNSGWVADGYHLTDYGSTIERVRWQAEHDPVWSDLLLAPWHGYIFPCSAVGCNSSAVHLPAATTWRPSPDVRTLSYGVEDIVYSVNISQPVLMVENELAIRGWHADTSEVHIVNAGIPLRAWRLSPGRYQFTATYHERGRLLQELMAAAALAAWLSCALALRRKHFVHPDGL